MSQQIACKIELRAYGWWLTFADPHAGLLLDTNKEKLQFLLDCEIEIVESDLDRFLKQIEIVECPIAYYQRACEFSISFA